MYCCKRIWIAGFIVISGIFQLITYKIFHSFNLKHRTLRDTNYYSLGLGFFDVFCMKTIRNDSDASYWINKYFAYDDWPYNENAFSDNQTLSPDCMGFIKRNGFTSAVTDEERDFPIAFSILIYKDPQQAFRLLRAIWRPQNVYCIHVDAKSNDQIRRYIKSRVQCLDNVFLAPRMIHVTWGTFSVLEADLICMAALYSHTTRWKYFINLTGQEFPLRTNYELVKILQLYAGANDIFGQFHKSSSSRQPPPHGIKLTKGPVHIVACRGFVRYVLYNGTARDFIEYTKVMAFADEFFFASLNNNPHLRVPGSLIHYVKIKQSTDYFENSKVRFKIFVLHKNELPCTTRVHHDLCIFGIGDLPRLTSAPHLFVNKFHQSYQQFAYDCLEHWIFKKIESEKLGYRQYDLSTYKNMYFFNNCYCPDVTQ